MGSRVRVNLILWVYSGIEIYYFKIYVYAILSVFKILVVGIFYKNINEYLNWKCIMYIINKILNLNDKNKIIINITKQIINRLVCICWLLLTST